MNYHQTTIFDFCDEMLVGAHGVTIHGEPAQLELFQTVPQQTYFVIEGDC